MSRSAYLTAEPVDASHGWISRLPGETELILSSYLLGLAPGDDLTATLSMTPQYLNSIWQCADSGNVW